MKMIHGRVIKSTGSWYMVETKQGERLECRVRGLFRNQKIRSTNPVAVGDWVKVEGQKGSWVISDIEPRRNYIARKSVNLAKQSHIIASNLDQAMLVATRLQPVTFPAFIDRFCVAAESFHIPVCIVFNKVDLLDEPGLEELKIFSKIYSSIGYRTILASTIMGLGLDEVEDALKGKVSLISGHSGVGKSTLINHLDASLNLRVGSVSKAHHTGQHTTTNAEMHHLSFGGYIVDTPGIRGFGLVDFDRYELAGYFPEMRERLPDCKYYNCLHINEPGCAVQEALLEGSIAPSRYDSYVSMFNDIQEVEAYRQ